MLNFKNNILRGKGCSSARHRSFTVRESPNTYWWGWRSLSQNTVPASAQISLPNPYPDRVTHSFLVSGIYIYGVELYNHSSCLR